VNKRAIAIGLAAGLVGGGAAAIALGGPGGAGAEVRATPYVLAQTDTTVAAEDGTTDRAVAREQALAEALAPLVEDGTITQAQADAVVARLVEAGPIHAGAHRGGRGFGVGLDTVAEILGMEAEDVRAAVAEGTTLAELAERQGVGRDALIDGIVAEVTSSLDEKVAAGDLTQAEADERLAAVTERIGDMVDRSPRLGGGRGGHHGPGRDTTDDATTTTTA
jgi:hypothetical protein